MRDKVRESYLAPLDHPVEVRLTGQVDGTASCAWTFDDGDGKPRSTTAPCTEPINLRVVFGRPTIVVADISANGAVSRATTEILVNDLLIAGLGDSIAAGEGNPDRPIALADDGFCFRQFVATEASEYFRPGRAGFRGDKSCGGLQGSESDRLKWSRLAARWMSAPCHRSLYSYQLRAALALAVENPHIAVTFLPLACTGATIETGLFGSQRARELNCGPTGNHSCPRTVPPQLARLRELLASAQRAHPGRMLDLVFLTVGANDIDFSGLVADVIIEARAERILFRRGGMISNVGKAQAVLNSTLPSNFARLRAALRPLVGGELNRVVFVSYGNPALSPSGGACPGGRAGFDVHPSFGVDGERLRQVATFVERGFLPRLRALATCSGGTLCGDPAHEAMTFVAAHQPAFAQHGYCAQSPADPVFDRECFSATGESFATGPVEGATRPLRCGLAPGEFRPYASRARWIRTANDSYFTAMTFPEGVSATLQPSNLHDATWGVLSAVYGGAVHPTAEGHAAMADAAAAAARTRLGLAQPLTTITAAPLGTIPAPITEPVTGAYTPQ
jgi:lysophospholipase L1-like esterase